MNSQDFQTICETLHVKYDEGRLTDGDVDAFADITTNVLGRDDLRAEGTAYERLAGRINHDYENDIAMNPLLARMYELCRMYAMYRPRPLTEMERKEEQMESSRVLTKKYPVCISITCDRRVVASCWWEDLGGMDEIAEKVCSLAATLPEAATSADSVDLMLLGILDSFAKVGGGLDPLDSEMIARMQDLAGEDPIAISDSPELGIVALDRSGVERNRERQGASARMDILSREVSMDAYTIYGVGFYKELIGKDADWRLPAMEELREEDVSFSFEDAEPSCRDWQERIGDMFSIPGSKSIVGTKKPLAVR